MYAVMFVRDHLIVEYRNVFHSFICRHLLTGHRRSAQWRTNTVPLQHSGAPILCRYRVSLHGATQRHVTSDLVPSKT